MESLRRPQNSQSGFTLIELIVVMIVIGILAVVVLPRFDLLKGFDEIGYRDKVRATLEYARKSAVGQRRSVRVAINAGNGLTLDVESCHPEGTAASTPACANILGTFPRPLLLPATSTNTFAAPSGVTLAGPSPITFDPLGRPSAAATYTVTGSTAYAVTVEAETGYVH